MKTPSEQQVPDLVVLSHLRWPWVWQRPQHLIARLAATRADAGARTFFVEEPLPADVSAPQLQCEEVDGVVRVVLLVPQRSGTAYLGFNDPGGLDYPARLKAALSQARVRPSPDVWLYTPMALPFLQALEPGLVVYDVMDDLASFAGAAEEMRDRQRELLTLADLVFTGGRSLHSSITSLRRAHVHLFPSGVETSHYARARSAERGVRSTRVAGYIGVIDERIDLALVADLARSLPDWTIRMVGPVTKIDEADLPQGANIEYPGMVDYARLPDELARFDVALMPFALNEATSRISPTKTLEYFAAGLPVVSTRVPDVVADYGEHVHLADSGAEFAASCRRLAAASHRALPDPVRSLLRRQEWDFIAEAMDDLIESTRSGRDAGQSHHRPSVTRSGSATVGSAPKITVFDELHQSSVRVAAEGIRDPLDNERPAGDGVPLQPERTVAMASSTMPAQQPPRGFAVGALHPESSADGAGGSELCPTCLLPVPCPTARGLR